MMDGREFVASLVAGGMAGMCVDLTLFPLDTIKTRLQSQQGFYTAGGFRGIYAGVPSAAIGSFPNAALFFVTYECTKSVLGPRVSTNKAPFVHMIAASLGEMVACLIRVPTEVVKQRAQACPSMGTYKVFIDTIRQEGILGLYRGFGSTIKREFPRPVTFCDQEGGTYDLLPGLHKTATEQVPDSTCKWLDDDSFILPPAQSWTSPHHHSCDQEFHRVGFDATCAWDIALTSFKQKNIFC
ncbi:mitochondrial S-adenosylmethionine carrier protein isoform X3 [Heptranchias perlo]|uniref:mitochondrial S-adenosylmethionine carrier protein isoform X3 n=1 Tax=Heptranchias perlo TaxID=212740 RepID=UPI00355ACB29